MFCVNIFSFVTVRFIIIILSKKKKNNNISRSQQRIFISQAVCLHFRGYALTVYVHSC